MGIFKDINAFKVAENLNANLGVDESRLQRSERMDMEFKNASRKDNSKLLNLELKMHQRTDQAGAAQKQWNELTKNHPDLAKAIQQTGRSLQSVLKWW